MPNIIQIRARNQLIKLIDAGSHAQISRLAFGAQAVGAVGLLGPRPKQTFRLVFANNDTRLDAINRAMGVNCFVEGPSLSCAEDEAHALALIRRLEGIAAIADKDRWQSFQHVDEFYLDHAVQRLMFGHASVAKVVRDELRQAITANVLDEAQASIENQLDAYADYKR